MKFAHYRNPAIKKRLSIAAEKWQNSDPGHTFEKPDSPWLFPLLKKIGTHLLLLLPLIILHLGKRESFLLLILLLPLLATTTLSNLIATLTKARGEESTYLLPISDATIDRQTHSELPRPFIKGLCYAMLYGYVAAAPPHFLIGAFTAGLIFIALMGLLTLALLPKMGWLYSALFFGPIALLFAAIISDQIMELLQSNIHLIPWFHALSSPASLAILLATGLLAAHFTRSRWWNITPLDRTQYYEINGSPYQEYELDEKEDLILSKDTPLPKSPQGLMEKIIWKFLNIKERALVRAVGGTSVDHLRGWFLGSTSALFLLWLGTFAWPAPLEEFKTLLLLVPAFYLYFYFASDSPTSISYLEGISISANAIGAQFQLLPISLNLLEKLHWKEILPRAILSSVTATTAIALWFQIPPTVEFIGTQFMTCFFVITPSFWFYFWSQSINHWVPKKGTTAQWSGLLKVFLLLGLLGLASGFIFAVTDHDLPLKAALVTSLFLAFIRLPLRTLLKSKRCDLMTQS